jgi:predicted DNA-binding protein
MIDYHVMLDGMEINTGKIAPEGKVVFLRLSPKLYAELEELRSRTKGRGVATVIRQIVEAAISEGITVRNDLKKGSKKNGRSKGRVEAGAVA